MLSQWAQIQALIIKLMARAQRPESYTMCLIVVINVVTASLFGGAEVRTKDIREDLLHQVQRPTLDPPSPPHLGRLRGCSQSRAHHEYSKGRYHLCIRMAEYSQFNKWVFQFCRKVLSTGKCVELTNLMGCLERPSGQTWNSDLLRHG